MNQTAILDTGTTFFYMPTQEFKVLFEIIKASKSCIEAKG